MPFKGRTSRTCIIPGINQQISVFGNRDLHHGVREEEQIAIWAAKPGFLNIWLGQRILDSRSQDRPNPLSDFTETHERPQVHQIQRLIQHDITSKPIVNHLAQPNTGFGNYMRLFPRN